MIVETTYKCSNCGVTDHDRSPFGQRPPVALNCWRCKAGFGKDLAEMLALNIGMFPVTGSAHA